MQVRSERRSRGALVALVVALVALTWGTLTAVPAGAAVAGTGWLRTAHLSPDTGAVDVWVTSFTGTPGAATTQDVTYGDVTTYRSLPAGYYTVAMRPHGASVSTPAMLSQAVQVTAGHAYSVLAVGSNGALALRVVPDDLTTPAPARARVRLIQASTASPSVDVRAVAGPVLAADAAYGLVSRYAQVPQGRWTLQVMASTGGGRATSAQVDVRAGSVVSLLVLDRAGGGVMVKPVTDAAAAAVMPAGGVNTGEGGLAGPDPDRSNVALRSGLLGLLVAAGVLCVLPAARRRRGALPAQP